MTMSPRRPHTTAHVRAARRALLSTALCLGLSLYGLGPQAPLAYADPGSGAPTQPQAKGEPAAAARAVIHGAIEAALKILRDEKLRKDSATRVKHLRAAVNDIFDWEAMARSSIGPHWRKLDDQQRADFVNVFKELLARQYMDDIDRFQGSETLNITGTEPRGQQVLVKTVLTTASREEVPIDYTMHRPQSAWVVEDISIEGVSMVNHYRKTFGRYLVNSDFPSLLAQLKRKLGTP